LDKLETQTGESIDTA